MALQPRNRDDRVIRFNRARLGKKSSVIHHGRAMNLLGREMVIGYLDCGRDNDLLSLERKLVPAAGIWVNRQRVLSADNYRPRSMSAPVSYMYIQYICFRRVSDYIPDEMRNIQYSLLLDPGH